jgi:hypothetical protein
VKKFKPNKAFLSLVIISFFLFSSCFEIIEEINLNNDGSGSFCFTVNLSQSKLQINSMLLLDSVNGKPVPKTDDIAAALDKVESSLKQEPGLSEILVKRNWEEYIFSVSGNFSNIAVLNKAINKVYNTFERPGKQTFQNKENFSFQNKSFDRNYDYDLKTQYQNLPEKDKVIFDNAKYTTIYRFPFMVGTFSNPDAKLSKSGKAIMLKVDIKDLISNIKTIKNSINLK